MGFHCLPPRRFEQLSDHELRSLERKMGKLFYFTGMNPTGHYKLQLESKFDAEILRKIVEIASQVSEHVPSTFHRLSLCFHCRLVLFIVLSPPFSA